MIISTHMKEIGQEIFSWRLFDESLYDICFCPVLHRAAACGDDCLKIIENVGNAWRQVKSESVRFDRKREGQIHSVKWTEDGPCVPPRGPALLHTHTILAARRF